MATPGPDASEATASRAGLLDDAPVGRGEDRLGRAPFAARLADQFASLDTPSSIVVGLYGRWGEGKTSVLNMVEDSLADHPSVIPVRFNPWLYEGHAQLLIAFFETVAGALGRALDDGKSAAKVLRAVGKGLSFVSLGIGPISLTPSRAFKELADQLDSFDMAEARKRVEKILAKEGKRVVLIVDDIDRLDDDEVAMLFKLIKLAADFDHTAYLLAMDEGAVAKSLAKRYSGSPHFGSGFVEKIVQLPLQLPRADPELILQMVFDGLNDAIKRAEVEPSEEDLSRIAVSFRRYIGDALNTPRAAKRFLNGFNFALASLRSEVNLADLVLLEGMRAVFPDLHEAIRQNKVAAIASGIGSGGYMGGQMKDLVKETFDPVFKEMTDADARRARELLGDLFPNTRTAYENHSYSDGLHNQWRTERRACAPEYFDRYFAYAVPPGDVANLDIDSLFATIADIGPVEGAKALVQLMSSGRAESVIAKLREREGTVDPTSASVLLLAVALLGGALPEYKGMFGLARSPFNQAAVLVASLAARLPDADRIVVLSEAMREAPDVTFAAEIFNWVRPSQSGESIDRRVSENEVDHLGRQLAERISRENEEHPIFEAHGKRAALLLFIWTRWGDPSEVRRVNEWAVQSSENALAVIRAFAADSWSAETGVDLGQSFRAEGYEAVESYGLDVEGMAEVLEAEFGAADPDADLDFIGANSNDERLARQFIAIHKQRTQAVDAPDSEGEAGQSPSAPS